MILENFISYKNYRWFRFNLLFITLLTFIYFIDNPLSGRRGDTFIGYTYGGLATIGIFTMMWFGIRKRSYSSNVGTVMGWLSAHVWIGFSLILIVPLHSGFQFGGNIHTLAYGLLVTTILSGIWGAFNYVQLSSQIPSHRGGDKVEDLAKQIRVVSQVLKTFEQRGSDQFIKLINRIDIPLKFRLKRLKILKTSSKSFKDKKMKELIATIPKKDRDMAVKAVGLVEKKRELMGKLQQELTIKHWLKFWLYFHLPLSFALLAALGIHVFSVFYYQ